MLAALLCLAIGAASAAPRSRGSLQHHAAAWQPRRLPGADLLQSHLSNAGSRERRLTLAVPGAPNLTSITSVLDWGAVGDGNTDNTAAFQAALNSVANGGIVFVPAGQYSFAGSLTMPTATSLVGTYVTVPSHEIDQGAQAPTDGSILMPRGGRGSENGTAFLSVAEDCTLKGFAIYYPDQPPTAAPAPYPWAIAMSGNNPAVQDVELLNPWNGISAVGAARHYIARVQGQPANIGIFVDETYDIGRIENVHWNPWYSANAAYIAHQTVFGQGFVFARTDWEYVLNTFVFAMSVGYRFVESPTGSCNGNFLGIGADCCQNASVLVDAADPWGILITNGEFTSFAGTFGPDVGQHTQVVVSPSNAGAVRISNSAFWGPSNQIAHIQGSGSVGFDSCIFNAWDAGKQGLSAIQASGGNVLVRGCEFQEAKPQVQLDAGVNKAVVTGNIISGAASIVNNGALVAVIANNAADA